MDYKNIKFIKRGKKTPINYTGRKFGNLIVIKPLDNYGDFYLFECDCGKQFEGKKHLWNDRKSCGCARNRAHTNQRKYKDTTIKNLYYIHKTNGKKAKHNSFLDYEDWLKLSLQECYYCGNIDQKNVYSATSKRKLDAPLLNDQDYKKYNVYINGIDRLNSDLGYELNNVVSCCKRCNTHKMAYSIDEFKKWIEIVYNRLCLS